MKCTCGTQGNGICSDWCDSLKPGADYIPFNQAENYLVTGEVVDYFSDISADCFVNTAAFRAGEQAVHHIAVSEDGKGIVAKQYPDGVLLVHAEFTTTLKGSWKAVYDAKQAGLPTADCEIVKMIREHFDLQAKSLVRQLTKTWEGVFKVDSDVFEKEWDEISFDFETKRNRYE